MTLAHRLERLTPALSAQERFRMALDQYKRDAKVTVDLGGLSLAQRHEYTRYARLVTALNHVAEAFAPLVGHRAEWLTYDLRRIAELDLAAEELERAEGLPPQEPSRGWRKAEEVPVSTFLRGLAIEQRRFVAREADRLGQELQAVEIVHQELAEELGEDPMHPSTQASLERAQEAVAALRRSLGLKKVPAPSPETKEQVRAWIKSVAGADDID